MALKLELARMFAIVMRDVFHQNWLVGYNGVCHVCNSPLQRTLFRAISAGTNPDEPGTFLVIPRVIKLCPYCGTACVLYRIYPHMEVSKEFANIRR